MKQKEHDCDSVILVGDVGGTNTNLALIVKTSSGLDMRIDRHYGTKAEKSLVEPTKRFLAEAASIHPGLVPGLCCISGAGVLAGRTIELTNAPWSIDGNVLESELGMPVILINDFTAISYGILLLDQSNPEQIIRLPHTDGRLPDTRPGVSAILGAGTGLGLAYVIHAGERAIVMASEGGHATLPVYDDETRAFQAWLERRYGCTPGAEAGISGQGIANLFEFFSRGHEPFDPQTASILKATFAERPALIAAAAAGSHPTAMKSMETFVKLYARKAADICATFLPTGGIFLAGGIASKNEFWFTDRYRFMEMFEKSYAKHIRSVLAETPVMIVKDYSISLYGAAKAAISIS